ncbi:MAG: hypothetical protein U5O69_02520 [Candidatus Competibacteraceae bacterium]|nr:hypothetical protein [Candidatus Competibacteraceae bacterium]
MSGGRAVATVSAFDRLRYYARRQGGSKEDRWLMSFAFKVAHAAEDWRTPSRPAPTPSVRWPARRRLCSSTSPTCWPRTAKRAHLRQKTGVQHRVGSVGMGICAGGEEYSTARRWR